jgi:hypothetical protein
MQNFFECDSDAQRSLRKLAQNRLLQYPQTTTPNRALLQRIAARPETSLSMIKHYSPISASLPAAIR